jgi:hypothetical protein
MAHGDLHQAHEEIGQAIAISPSAVIGAHALAAHGHVRATKDLDVWVRCDPANAERVHRALRSFGAPTANLSEADLATPGLGESAKVS